MHTAQITQWGQPPVYKETEELPIPAADSDLVQVKVTAVGAHRVVRSRASGQHYSAKALPHTLGTDGCGTLPNGQPVYFSNFGPGSFSDYVNVSRNAIVPLPDGADPVQFAALVNPAFSSWMALTTRCSNLPPNFSVLIMGATSASGLMANYFARILGAGKVIGVARRASALAEAGLDDSITLCNPVESTDFSKANDVDVILDYTYGPPTLELLKSLKSTKPVQYVQIGSLTGARDIALPGDVLRSKDITLRGAGPGSWTRAELGAALPKIVGSMVHMKPQKVHTVPLKEIECAWDAPSDGRLVFLP